MSENFFENFKKYGIWIAWFVIIAVIVHFVKPEELYWRKDITDNKVFVHNTKIYIVIAIILTLVAIFKIYKTLEEEYKDNPKEKVDFIFYSVIVSFFLILIFTYKINLIIADSRLLINKQFEKETETNNFKIELLGTDFVDIKKLNGGYERIDIDSVLYKNIKPKDSIAVVKSKIGLFKIPYNHEIVEIK